MPWLIDKETSSSGTLQPTLSTTILRYNDLAIDLNPPKSCFLISDHFNYNHKHRLSAKFKVSNLYNGIEKTEASSGRFTKASQGESRART